MTHIASDELEELIRLCDQDWLINSYSPPEAALPHFHEVLRAADQESRARFGEFGPRLTPGALAEEYKQHPHRVRAFLQALGSLESPRMLVLAWRLLQGVEISSIRLNYDADRTLDELTARFELRICL